MTKLMRQPTALALHVSRSESETEIVKTEILQKILELSKSMLEGNYSRRVTTDFEDTLITQIVDNLNRYCDRVQLESNGLTPGNTQDQTVATFIEVLSSFTSLDFKQKLPISENGTVMDAIATGINILGEELEFSTASKKDLERERNRLDEAQAIAKIGSWELSLPSFNLECSKEAYRIFESAESSETDLYKMYLNKVHPEDISKVDGAIRLAIENKNNFTVEHRILCNNGSIKFILCTGEVVMDDKNVALRWKGTFQDITDCKKVEEKLLKAKEQAEDANKAKSRFLANMSHEIRTPLNGILGLTEVMMSDKVSDEHREYLKLIRTSGKNLSNLINDILDFSKIESGNLQLESIAFNFKEVITSCILPYKFLAEQKGVALFYTVDSLMPAEVIGDPTRFSQIITNLVGNAIKFTHSGKVDVSFSVVNIDGEEITIQGIVEDTGVGITKEARGKIFKSFSQADETVTRKYGGTGLGLSIVKSLLQQMNGDITLKSPVDTEHNTGTSFTFTIKCKHIAQRLDATLIGCVSGSASSKDQPHILVIDDNKINLLVAKKMLQKFGAEVTTAESGLEAIGLVKEHDYDLLLMDVQMPEMDGCETTRELRRLGFNGQIVALSANAYEEDVLKSLNAGMNDHLLKPYTEAQLFSMLSKFLMKEN